MPTNDPQTKLRLMPEVREQLGKRAPRISGGASLSLALGSIVMRYTGLLESTLTRMQCELPDPQDWAFLRFTLSSVVIDDLTVSQMPLTYLSDVREAMEDYEGQGPWTASLPVVMQRWGALEAVALVDWVERQLLQKD
jgi:hypothetical protein